MPDEPVCAEIKPDFLEDLPHEHDDEVTSFVYRNVASLDRGQVKAFVSEIVEVFRVDVGPLWGRNEVRETGGVFIRKQLP